MYTQIKQIVMKLFSTHHLQTADSDQLAHFFFFFFINNVPANKTMKLFLTHHLHIVFFEVVLLGALRLLSRTHLTHTRYLPDTLNTV